MKEKVSVVKCGNYRNEVVRKALEKSLRNIDFEFKAKKVLIKPNLLMPAVPDKAITTHPVMIEELCKILIEKGVKEIYIGDSSAFNTDNALKVCGMSRLAKYAKVVNFEAQEKKFFDLGEGELSNVPLPKIAFDVDLVISFAKLKTHMLTCVTLCVKNLYGCVPGKLKEQFHRVLPSAKDFSRLIVGIYDEIKPQLNIIDGVYGIEGKGPSTSGTKIKAGVVIASKNGYCADIVATRLMGFKPKQIYTNKYSRIKEKDIEVVGNGKEVKFKFEKPGLKTIPVIVWLSRFLPKSKISFNHEKCPKCGTCGAKCPVKAISYHPYPECEYDKCIRCLCCIEVCPESAVSLEDPKARQFLQKVARKIGF